MGLWRDESMIDSKLVVINDEKDDSKSRDDIVTEETENNEEENEKVVDQVLLNSKKTPLGSTANIETPAAYEEEVDSDDTDKM